MAPNWQEGVSKAVTAREAQRAITDDASPRVDQNLDLMRRYLAAVAHASRRPPNPRLRLPHHGHQPASQTQA